MGSSKNINSLDLWIEFYNDISISCFSFSPKRIGSVVNIDTYCFKSISCSLSSIRDVLTNSRINDAYTLLRKYLDSVTINMYEMLYLEEHDEEFTVDKIDKWVKGMDRLPTIKEMTRYIVNSAQVKCVNEMFKVREVLIPIRERCNDYTHYNFFRTMLHNDKDLYLPNRLGLLDLFYSDLDAIFTYHLMMLFCVRPYYFSSSDYLDALELGLEPKEGDQYLLAPYAQKIFDEVLGAKYPEIATYIKANSSMIVE